MGGAPGLAVKDRGVVNRTKEKGCGLGEADGQEPRNADANTCLLNPLQTIGLLQAIESFPKE